MQRKRGGAREEMQLDMEHAGSNLLHLKEDKGT